MRKRDMGSWMETLIAEVERDSQRGGDREGLRLDTKLIGKCR